MRLLAVAALVLVAAGHEALAEPDGHGPEIQAVAASRQLHQSQTCFDLAILPDGRVRCWGSGCPRFPSTPKNAVAVAAGDSHALILHGNGTVVQFVGAANRVPSVPVLARAGVTAIAAGQFHSLALRRDGTVVAWGASGSAGLPNRNTVIPADAQTGVTAIAAGYLHSLALRDDGRVVQWGTFGKAPPEVSSDVVAIAGGWTHSLAVKRSGRVIEWNLGGTLDRIPIGAESDVVAVAAGVWHNLALRADGTVVAWEDKWWTRCAHGVGAEHCGKELTDSDLESETFDLADPDPAWLAPPVCASLRPKVGSVRSIAAGGYRSLALLSDGTVVGWGDPVPYFLPSVPGHERRPAPAVPINSLGADCVTGLTGIRVLR